MKVYFHELLTTTAKCGIKKFNAKHGHPENRPEKNNLNQQNILLPRLCTEK